MGIPGSKPPAPVKPSPLTLTSHFPSKVDNAHTKQIPKRPPPPSCPPISTRTTTPSNDMKLPAKNSAIYCNADVVSGSAPPGRPPPPRIPLPKRKTPDQSNAINNTPERDFSSLAITPSPRDTVSHTFILYKNNIVGSSYFPS